jgi:hypothetical protein
MKTEDLLLYGGIAAGVYFFIIKPRLTPVVSTMPVATAPVSTLTPTQQTIVATGQAAGGLAQVIAKVLGGGSSPAQPVSYSPGAVIPSTGPSETYSPVYSEPVSAPLPDSDLPSYTDPITDPYTAPIDTSLSTGDTSFESDDNNFDGSTMNGIKRFRTPMRMMRRLNDIGCMNPDRDIEDMILLCNRAM